MVATSFLFLYIILANHILIMLCILPSLLHNLVVAMRSIRFWFSCNANDLRYWLLYWINLDWMELTFLHGVSRFAYQLQQLEVKNTVLLKN